MSIAKDLVNQGYSIQPLAAFDNILNFQEAWEKFVKLPLVTKQRFVYENGCGYEFKGKKVTFDEKDNFHFAMRDVTRLSFIKNRLGRMSEHVMEEFIQAGIQSYKTIEDFVFEKLIPEIEPLMIPECDLEVEMRQSAKGWVQRSLYYHPDQDVQATIADAHPDRGFITLAYFASQTGLQILDIKNKQWKSITVPAGSVLIMFGLQGQYLTGGQVKALYHRVLNSDDTIKYGRYAQVGFADNRLQPTYNKKKHGSTQLKPIGYNYDCSHEFFLETYL